MGNFDQQEEDFEIPIMEDTAIDFGHKEEFCMDE